jgi:hypothetical protein
MLAQIAARSRWAKEADRRKATKAAQRGLRAKFEREADPECVLSPEERAYRADQLMKAHMLRLSLKAKQARRRKAETASAAAEE